MIDMRYSKAFGRSRYPGFLDQLEIMGQDQRPEHGDACYCYGHSL